MMSLPYTHSQFLMPGLHQANTLIGGRSGFRPRSAQGRSLCEQSLAETVRRLECLSQSELQVLAKKTASALGNLLGSNQVQPPNWEESIGTAFSLLNKASSSQDCKSDYLLPKSRLLRSQQSPLLLSVRGFKTKRSDSKTDKPFTSLNSSQTAKTQADVLNDILKHIDLPKSEKEKVNIALLSYATGYATAKDPDGTQSQNPEKILGGKSAAAEKKKWFEWSRIHNFTSILIIIAILISLGQVLNIPALRFNRGGNEISPEDVEVTFDDVKGCDEAKQELQEVVEFLMNPDKFSALGGRLPKGCLLIGPPGTGKTLLARAVAGQAGVPFFHASGSEFDEVLVGQGARRVRDLFKAAKARAPCVIFIDEIDSVGSKRTSSVLHPYANQTINQLLNEMDGFMSNEGVVVLGATNRSEDLDRALLRPGRFDTQVTVPNPDIKGRREILILYLSKIKHDSSVDIEKLAKMTVGFSGADLQNMVNTAAIRAAIEGKDWVTMAEFEYSHDKHVLGTDWKSRVREKKDLEITAFHEAGHTLVAYFTPESNPLHKVTIVAKGQSGGHTAFLPNSEEWHVTRSQFLAKIDVAMGGRAAEEIVFGKDKVTGGSSSDLESASGIAEVMVKNLGMSEKIGLRVYQDDKTSPGTKEAIDTEISLLLTDAYKRASHIIKTHRRELDLLAEALLHYETLDIEDIKAIIENKKPPPARPVPNSLLAFNSRPLLPSAPLPVLPKSVDPKGPHPVIKKGEDVIAT